MATDVMASAEFAQLSLDDTVSDKEGDVAEDGVLLYYKFAQIDDPDGMKTWLFDLCSSLGLLGRIRVAPDGINITVRCFVLSSTSSRVRISSFMFIGVMHDQVLI